MHIESYTEESYTEVKEGLGAILLTGDRRQTRLDLSWESNKKKYEATKDVCETIVPP
jgi:hypothetical protein